MQVEIIPKSLAEAAEELAGISALMTAKEWKRAAIVYAFTHGAPKGGPRENRPENRAVLSQREFAAVGIIGLTHQETVARYYNAWALAVKRHEAQAVKPGDPYIEPKMDWPPDTEAVGRNLRDPERRDHLIEQAQMDGVGQTKVLDVASNPRALTVAIKADPETRKAAEAALRDVRDREIDDRGMELGIDWKAPLERFPVEALAEADRIATRLRYAATDIRKLREWAPADEWRRCSEIIDGAMSSLLRAIAPVDWKEKVE